MSSILSTAFSGLNAFQTALTVIGNNITNATTQGYSRQTIQLIPGITQKLGNSYIGSGVGVSAIVRNADAFASYQVRNSVSVNSQYATLYQQSSQIDKLLSQDGINLTGAMQDFFTAFGQMNSNPNSSTRNVVFTQSQLLANKFNYLQSKLDEYQNNSTLQVKQTVQQINTLTQNISDLNRQISSAPNASNLLDQRDNLLEQLSQYMDVNSVVLPNGSVNVTMSNGGSLVVNDQSHQLVVETTKSASFGTKITLNGNEVTANFSSGSIKGLLDFENNVLSRASQLIGQMSIGLAQAFNKQNSLGLDLDNKLGGNYFTDYNSAALQKARASYFPTNTGTASLSIAIADIAQTQVSDYQLNAVDPANNKYNLLRKSDGVSIAVELDLTLTPPTFKLAGTNNTTIDGMTIKVDSGTFSAKDMVTIAPTRGAATNLSVALTDFRGIALAGPAVTSTAATNNTSQASLTLNKVNNTNSINTEFTVTFTSATQFTLSPDPSSGNPYTISNNTLYIPDSTSPSYSLTLSGTPSAGDKFTLTPNAGGPGDNGNGLLLANIQTNKLFSGGTESLVEKYSNLVAGVGSDTKNAQLMTDSAGVMLDQARSAQESTRGVNLDEEAANLLKFQQAYQAAGKLMQVANQMMDIILDSMR